MVQHTIKPKISESNKASRLLSLLLKVIQGPNAALR
jgi:hypothetical protein